MTSSLPPSLLAGLIGAGIQASRTPPMHEREGAELGLRYLYRIIDLDQLGLGVEALPELLTAAERMGFAGLNITYPCKQRVIPYLSELSNDAKALNAVNTVVFREGLRVGHNSDWWGFAESFRRGLPDVSREQVVQLGAGGAGSAVAYALLTLGVQRLAIFDLDLARAQAVAAALEKRFGLGRARAIDRLAEAVAEANGVVNTTPVGMAKLPGIPLPLTLLRPELWVAEIVYFPLARTSVSRAAAPRRVGRQRASP